MGVDKDCLNRLLYIDAQDFLFKEANQSKKEKKEGHSKTRESRAVQTKYFVILNPESALR